MSDKRSVEATKDILVAIDDDQIVQSARAASELQSDVDETNKELADLKEEYNEAKRTRDASIEGKETRISELLREVKLGKKKLLAQKVTMEFDYNEGIVNTIWINGAGEREVVDSRALEAGEHQLTLIEAGSPEAAAIAESVPAEGQEIQD